MKLKKTEKTKVFTREKGANVYYTLVLINDSHKPINKTWRLWQLTQPAITCSKLTIETLEQGVKYVQN